MYHSSTQKAHWVFKDEAEVKELRERTNASFSSKQKPGSPVLNPSEEYHLFRYYQKKLVELCNLFAPPKWVPLPRTALVSAA
jgi:cyclin H